MQHLWLSGLHACAFASGKDNNVCLTHILPAKVMLRWIIDVGYGTDKSTLTQADMDTYRWYKKRVAKPPFSVCLKRHQPPNFLRNV